MSAAASADATAAELAGPVAPPLTVGTAGHIDHGKSALVQALTGGVVDRLPEERTRGMTIALGYASLALPGRTVSMIDVPGHERFVRTMVAGASGVDMYLLGIAPDDGAMPQTLEHMRVLRALGVEAGVVAVTKCDLADPARAAAAAARLAPGAPVVCCSARSGAGIGELAQAIERVAGGVASRPRDGAGVMHVDRCFTIRGAGTVVTGTLWRGTFAAGQRLRLLPCGQEVRVRGVQVHDRRVQEAAAGQRVAVNLAAVRRTEVQVGDVLADRDADLAPSYRLDLALDLEQAGTGRVQVHHGTRDVPARLVDLGEGFWQARLQKPLIAAPGDRVVIRSIAPPDTLGGGVALDARPARHGPSAELRDHLRATARSPRRPPPSPATPSRERRGAGSQDGTVRAVAERPLSAPALALEQRLREAGTRPPTEQDLGELAVHLPELRAAGRAVRVGRSMYAHPEALAGLAARVRVMIETQGPLTLAGLRDELGGSRRYAQALLEHLDAARVTRRLPDDRRVLRRAPGVTAPRSRDDDALHGRESGG